MGGKAGESWLRLVRHGRFGARERTLKEPKFDVGVLANKMI